MKTVYSEQRTVNSDHMSENGQKLLVSRVCKVLIPMALSCLMLFLLCLLVGVSIAAPEEQGGESEFLYAMPITATASSLEAIYNWDDLASWLQEHKETGGTVTLSADIEAADFSFFNFEQDITIDTGQYGITVTGSMMTGLWYDAGPILEIRGEGVNRPVLSFGGSWLSPEDTVFTAYGNGSGGGVALHLDGDWSNYGVAGALFAHSYGVGAVGISCGGSISGTGLKIESDGVAIDAVGNVDLFASHISGFVNAGGQVTLDTCAVSPQVPGATVIDRKIKALTGGAYLTAGKPYVYQVSGRPADEGMIVEGGRLDAQVAYTSILGAEGESDRYTSVFVKYGRAPIDTETVGAVTTLRAELLYPFVGLDILPDDSFLNLTVETVDGSIPQYMSTFAGWSGYMFRYLYAGESLAPLTLWRADWNPEWDTGGSLAEIDLHWDVIWREDDPELAGASVSYLDFLDELSVTISRFNITAPVLLAIEVEGFGGSNVLYYDPDSGETNPDFVGGDRDGGDRILLPWRMLFGNPFGDAGNGDDDGDDDEGIADQVRDDKGSGGNGNGGSGSGNSEDTGYSGDGSGNPGPGSGGGGDGGDGNDGSSSVVGTVGGIADQARDDEDGNGNSGDLPAVQSGAEENTNGTNTTPGPDGPPPSEEGGNNADYDDDGGNLILEPIEQPVSYEVILQGEIPLSEINPYDNLDAEIPEVSPRTFAPAAFDMAPPMHADEGSISAFPFFPVAAFVVATGAGASWLAFVLRKRGVFLRR